MMRDAQAFSVPRKRFQELWKDVGISVVTPEVPPARGTLRRWASVQTLGQTRGSYHGT